MLNGFPERLESDLHSMTPPGSIIKVIAPPGLILYKITCLFFLLVFFSLFSKTRQQRDRKQFGREQQHLEENKIVKSGSQDKNIYNLDRILFTQNKIIIHNTTYTKQKLSQHKT